MNSKSSLRQKVRAALKAQSPADRKTNSLKIQQNLEKLPAYRKARTVCFYVALDTEVDTVPMIRRCLSEGKRVLVPRVDNLENKDLKLYEIRDLASELKPGTMGILEPDPAVAREAKLSDPDCVIVPGLAFDKKNRRLGRGGAFYDKFLAALPKDRFKVGLAFSFQVFPEIPFEPHDVLLDEIITEV